MEITHLGHACVLLETDGARLLLDPGTMSAFEGVHDLDAILVTHQHADHLDPSRIASLLAANPRAQLVVDPDTAGVLPPLPVVPVVGHPGDRLTLAGCSVRVLGGIHAAVYGAMPGCTNAAYLIDEGALLHPGDSFVIPDVEVDVLLAPIDGPWLKLAETIDFVDTVGPRVAVPIHEGETRDPTKYTRLLASCVRTATVVALVPGQPTVLGE